MQTVQHESRGIEIRRGKFVETITPVDAQRFYEKLVTRENGCIEWTGHARRTAAKYGYPYGVFRIGGKEFLAHRIAYLLAKGAMPAGYVVMHACDNGVCCNPEHLSLGTKRENSADMVRKGRSPRGDRHSSQRHPESVAKGERHHWHKLIDDDVFEIRGRYDGGESWSAIHRTSYARVSPQTVMRIARRLTWRHLP